MGGVCSSSSGTKEELAADHHINVGIVNQSKRELKTVKLLLLGAGDSGKTTIRKQIRSIYGEGFSEAVRTQLARVIISNLIDGAKDVINGASSIGISLSPDEAKQAANLILSLNSSSTELLAPNVAKAMAYLWENKSFQSVFARRSEFQVQDCWATFIRQVKDYPKWGGDEWIPSVADCIIARVRTSGIVEEHFVLDGVTFKLFDVGGQRAERRKWINCFDNVTAIIFVASLSEYDQVLYEDRSKNRLVEALELFDEICNSRWFSNTSTLLFLNKRDLFETKYLKQKIPLNASGNFPNAPSGDPDLKVALDWITSLFLRVNKNEKKYIYTHVTTATDPNNVRAVFDTSRNIILKRNLEASGFVMN